MNRYIEKCLFNFGKSVVMSVEVLFEHEHARTVLLRYLNHRFHVFSDQASHARLKIQPHEFIGWVRHLGCLVLL